MNVPAPHATGARTLEIFEGTPRFNAWMYGHFAGHVGGEVLEVGSGIGNLSRLLIEDADRATLTDVEDAYVERLRAEICDGDRVRVAKFDLGAVPPAAVLERKYDAVLAVNVIEHIEDDARATRSLFDLLKPGGRLLAYVPACAWAFGSLDEALGHFRRYTPRTFGRLLLSSGFVVEQPVRYVNLLGLGGWFVNGRVLRRRTLSRGQVALFERLVPLLRLEGHFPLPVGLGVVGIGRKPG